MRRDVLLSRRVLIFLALANLVGFFFGVYYYMPQLDETPQVLWLLVIDCPLYALLFSAVLLCHLLGWYLPDVLKFMVSVGLFKYGLWTVVVIMLYAGYFFSASPVVYSMLFVSHIVMALEAFLLLPLFTASRTSAVFVVLFFLACDLSDYVFLGTLPRIPPAYVSALFVFAVLVSVLFPALIHRVRRLP